MNIRSEIVTQFTQVAQDHALRLAPLTDDLELINSGLDSLCFAVVVIRLQDVLGVDPFSSFEDALFPVTFGQFVKFYENAATNAGSMTSPIQSVPSATRGSSSAVRYQE
jgi:hypothetical protein